jgi:HEPN domain-containing protein
MTPLTREWVRKAEEGRRTAALLRSCRPAVHAVIRFHCQQTAEKYLKALVQERGLAVPRTDDCRALVRLLIPTDPMFERFQRVADGLGRFSIDPRYPYPATVSNTSASRTA